MLINVLALRVWGSKVVSGAMSGFGGGSVFHTLSRSHGLTDEHRAVRLLIIYVQIVMTLIHCSKWDLLGRNGIGLSTEPCELHKWLWVKKTFTCGLYQTESTPALHVLSNKNLFSYWSVLNVSSETERSPPSESQLIYESLFRCWEANVSSFPGNSSRWSCVKAEWHHGRRTNVEQRKKRNKTWTWGKLQH